MNLFGWHRLTKLHGSQVHDYITPHLFTVWCVRHPRSSPLPSAFVSPNHSFTSSHPLLPAITTSLSLSMNFFSLFVFLCSIPPPPSFIQLPSPPSRQMSACSESVFILLVSSFCSLNSTYE